MRATPFTGFLYAIMGTLFTILAIQSIEDTIWNASTILLMAIAAFDFCIALRALLLINKK